MPTYYPGIPLKRHLCASVGTPYFFASSTIFISRRPYST